MVYPERRLTKTGSRRETGDGRREMGDGRWETGDARRETGDGRREEMGDRRLKTGNGRRKTGDARREMASRETGDGRRVILRILMIFGRTELRIGASKAKFDVESDFEVRLAVALQKPDQISEKRLKFLAKKFSAENFSTIFFFRRNIFRPILFSAENFSAEMFFGWKFLVEILSAEFFSAGISRPTIVLLAIFTCSHLYRDASSSTCR